MCFAPVLRDSLITCLQFLKQTSSCCLCWLTTKLLSVSQVSSLIAPLEWTDRSKTHNIYPKKATKCWIPKSAQKTQALPCCILCEVRLVTAEMDFCYTVSVTLDVYSRNGHVCIFQPVKGMIVSASWQPSNCCSYSTMWSKRTFKFTHLLASTEKQILYKLIRVFWDYKGLCSVFISCTVD